MYQVTLLNKKSILEVNQFLDLLQNSFNASLDYYEWKHNLNGDFNIEEYTFCIFHDNLCIATTQVIINEINISCDGHRFGILCDGATHKDYRRLGLFEKLLSHINVFCSEKDVSFVYSTGNEKSRKALLKLGFKDFFTTLKASKKIRYNHSVMAIYNLFLNAFRKVTLKTNDNIKQISISNYITLSSNIKSKDMITFEKTEDYLKWRLAEPTGKYKLYGAFDELKVLQAVAVIKTTKDLLYIVDIIYYENDKFINQLLQYVSGLAIRDEDIKKINCEHSNFKNFRNVFQKNKFQLIKNDTGTLFYAIKQGFNISPSYLNNMHYMRIDKNE